MKILVVDDDESILALLDQFLGGYCGYEVETSLCGLQALEMIIRASEPFECFLIDIQMPNVNGIELCRKIREMEKHAATPIMMLTAMTELRYIDRAFGAGADDYVTKPFEFADLKIRLENSQNHVRDRETAQDQTDSFIEIVGSDEVPPAVPFSQPINVCGVQGVLGNTSFENYIMQMSRTVGYGSSILAVQLTNAKAAFDQSSPDQFHEIVRLAARMVTETLDQCGGFISYRGSGVFLCVQNGKDTLSEDQIRAALNKKLHAQKLHARTRTRLSVGKQYSLRWVTNPDALEVLRGANRDANSATGITTGQRVQQNIPTPEDFTDYEDGDLVLQAYETLVQSLLNKNGPQSERMKAS